MKRERQITIDGPAASGKSTIARRVARRMNGIYINTGDMYRTVTWVALNAGIDVARKPERVAALLDTIEIEYTVTDEGVPQLLLNGQPVKQSEIRAPKVAAAVSYVAKIPRVRQWLVKRQRHTRSLGTIVMEGRDIGTVVFPDADYKFFLTASPEVRARRRLMQKGETLAGATVASVAAEIAERDRIDSSRSIAPLRPAPDAVIVDSSDMTPEEVTEEIVSRIHNAEHPA